jgi:hypothetical protein
VNLDRLARAEGKRWISIFSFHKTKKSSDSDGRLICGMVLSLSCVRFFPIIHAFPTFWPSAWDRGRPITMKRKFNIE